MLQALSQFSIVIPTYNRPDRLRNCLKAIAQVDYPRENFEVIVVDDGSKMLLNSVIEPFQSELSLTLLRQENAGPASARNAGAAIARGQFLVFTDDDCVPTSHWLKALDEQFQKTPDALVGGHTLNALPENIYSTASQLLIDYLYEHYNNRATTANFFASNNFALPIQNFQNIGGFDTTFPLAAGEDREFCDRWLYAGYTMSYAPEAQVFHAHHLTLRSFWKQHFNYGRGAFYFHQLRAQRSQQQIEVEPLSFYFNLLTYPSRQSIQPLLALGAMMLLFTSQVANVAGFFWQQNRA
jgi:GT2 family glycosyltransferase